MCPPATTRRRPLRPFAPAAWALIASIAAIPGQSQTPGNLRTAEAVRSQGIDTRTASTQTSARQDDAARAAAATARGFVARYCASCHGRQDPEAGLDLTTLAASDPESWRLEAPDDWFDAVAQVDGLGMPPPDADRAPTLEEREAFVDAVRRIHTARAPGAPRDPGAPVLRRLNRDCWQNTIRSLLGVSIQADQYLPQDPGGHGFDTSGDAMTVTPALVEQYLDATEAVVHRFLTSDNVARYGNPAQPKPYLERFVRAAFRRPLRAGEVARRVALVATAPQPGSNRALALKPAILATLLSPDFLFLVEARPDDAARVEEGETVTALDAHALATRLAYFLWSQPPDSPLRELADRGELTNPDVLRSQVSRMLDDPRAGTLSTRFAAQWLGFASLSRFEVDGKRFKGFGRIRIWQYQQLVQDFGALVAGNRRVADLLDGRRTHLNEPLAAFYGIDAGVRGTQMTEVELPVDSERRGVLGTGAVLTATSYPLRTNPVLRGKWILQTLLGYTIPPPPADAGTLPADDANAAQNLRAQLTAHRKDVRCAVCHARMDPLGLALESFDAVGRWRDVAPGGPIDVTNLELPDGTRIDGVADLRAWLVNQTPRFTRTMAARMMVYALGRPLTWADDEALDRVVRQTAEGDGRVRSMIEAIVTSYPFQHRLLIRPGD